MTIITLMIRLSSSSVQITNRFSSEEFVSDGCHNRVIAISKIWENYNFERNNRSWC